MQHFFLDLGWNRTRRVTEIGLVDEDGDDLMDEDIDPPSKGLRDEIREEFLDHVEGGRLFIYNAEADLSVIGARTQRLMEEASVEAYCLMCMFEMIHPRGNHSLEDALEWAGYEVSEDEPAVEEARSAWAFWSAIRERKSHAYYKRLLEECCVLG